MSEPKTATGLIALLDRMLVWIALIFGGVTLAAMTCLSVWNVLIMRKALNAPIIGAEEIMVLMLITVVALSIPLGARTGAHIEIEIFESRMSAGFAKWSMILVKAVGTALLATASWRLWHSGQTAERFGETTKQLLISYEPFYYLLSVSVAAYAIALVLEIAQLMKSGEVVRLKIGSDAL